jgi:hypothetical protein
VNEIQYIFPDLKANKINPKEISDQHFKDYESIANFQTKIDVLKIIGLVNSSMKNFKLNALFSNKDYLVQLPECPI